MKTTRARRRARWSGIGLALAFLLTAEASYVILSDGRRIEGTDIRARPDGTIVLTTARGPVEFARGQYARAVADKPAEWDQAQQLFSRKQYDAAVKLLEGIARSYRWLDWDIQAQQMLARVQAAKGDFAAALAAYEQLFRSNPASQSDPELQWAYRQALLDAKQYDRLAPLLTDVIAKGSRADAARAQIMRGDVKMAQGQAEGAVMDYLRVVVFFGAERASQPEALFKAAEGLEKLRDPRAKDMYRKLAQDYPNTPQGQQARSRI